jgi:hypothetical protein
MRVKAELGGEQLEIWFTPSFNIKTTDKEIEFLLRGMEYEVFDPWSLRMRKVKATKGLNEAYLVLDYLNELLPELKIKITEHPRPPALPKSAQEGENPAVH